MTDLDIYGVRAIRVQLPCQSYELIDEQEVEVLGIEEDFQGRDMLEFRCPECGEIHKSLRFG